MRVLAVTGDASLLVAITSMLRGDWEVQVVRDPASAANAVPGAVVVLVDFGTTERGLSNAEKIWELGVELPCLVVGDVPAPEARAKVLVRPFTLNDLIAAVNRLVPAPIVAPVVVEEIPAVEEEHDAGVDELLEELSSASEPPFIDPPDEPVVDEPEVIAPVQAPAEIPVVEEPRIPVVEEQRARGLFRRKPAPARPSAGDPLAEQIRRALTVLQDLDILIDKVPPLARPRAMAHAFLGEVVDLFHPEIAAVYVLANDGTFQVAASHGLSPVEAGMRVPPEQLLFMEITSSLEAVLIAPVDLAQGLVSGIGGARTEAIMAAPITVDGACHGVIIVGRKDFSSEDLDALADLANEAGPGLAVAQTIERLRSR
jgi:GAF domain-containing protein